MCGIAAYRGLEADEALLERLLATHPEAGPAATVTDGDAGLGVREGRPVRTSASPEDADRVGGVGDATGSDGGRGGDVARLAVAPGGRFTLALDGELYNRAELRGDLETLGHDFGVGSDAEVALAAFTEWGTDGLDRLDGAFAVVVWDRDTRRMTLARDPFGVRPLYIARAGEGWLVASEIGGILGSGLHERRPDDRTIYRYLRFRVHDDGPATFFAGIERVGAGEVVTLGADLPGGIERHPYSRLREELTALARSPRAYTPAAATEFRALLTDSVRRRSSSSGRVGTALSGGLDSAAIASLVDVVEREAGGSDEQDTWSAVYPASRIDEQAQVEAVTASLGSRVDAHRFEPTPSEFKKDMRDLVRTQEEPLGSTGSYTQYRVLQEAAQRDAVVLDGLGGDELLGGFGAHHLIHLRGLKGRSAALAASELGRSLDVLVRRGRPHVGDRLRGRKSVAVTSLLGADFARAHAGEAHEAERTDLRKRLVDDLFVDSLPSRLRSTDKNARRFGVSVRLPFVDRELARFVFGLDDAALIKDGLGKRVLRDAMRGLLPDSVVERRDKVGSTTPQADWFMRLKNHIYGEFLSESFANRPYFDQTAVLHAFEGWIKGTNSVDSMTIWRILNVELWLQEFFDERAPEADDVVEHVKSDYEPNARKQLDLVTADGTAVRRYPLRTDLYAREDDLEAKTLGYIDRFFAGLTDAGPEHDAATGGRWYFFISEKIVAITQGRSFFIWDIKVGRPARLLSRYVTRTPAGIGLGSPFTMQLAIEEAGLPRVLFASAGGAVGKVLGKRGLFYDLVGGDIRAIDGPTEYSVYPANVSAKLGPKDPDDVAARLSAAIRARVPEAYRDTFGGTVVMDANDIGRNVLGKDAPGSKERYELMFADNPLGQGSEQTPMAVVFETPSA
ncbi:asparagine synthase (glutamine-hydrolyzing) [Terrabacter tumescens]|uniref:asparagine synthase (glutamine-hydrolyzing) n=1 Tax=Terrabacter tumescens TaxID=60443 RepID=A0ABQ2I2G9_9MICO|nr:asparagine synthase-related protein [Terrabacter tumescens]GGM97701.1 asparagine synthase (glutamine-hydrolyzing) [Terrabacter tumescens]